MSDVEKYPSGSSDWASRYPDPPDYNTATAGYTQPVVPSAPPADVVHDQPHQLDPYPPQSVSADPNTTTTTTYITVTEAETDTEPDTEPLSRRRSHYHDSYCPGFVCCFFVPIPGPRAGGPGGAGGANCNCDCMQNCNCIPNCGDCGPNCGALPFCVCLPGCDCLPPTTACFAGGFKFSSLGGCFGCVKGGDNPVVIIIMLIVLALILILLVALIALFIYRMGDDKDPEIAKRYRVTALVFAFIGYAILIAVGITLAVMFV